MKVSNSIRAELLAAHNEQLFCELLKESAVSRLVVLLRFHGVEIVISHKESDTTFEDKCFALNSKRGCILFLCLETLSKEAKYNGVSLRHMLTASLFHEAGHICNFLKVGSSKASGSDEVEAWKTGFELYKRCSKKSILPDSFIKVSNRCLASYGLTSDGEYCEELQEQEGYRRLFWQAADSN